MKYIAAALLVRGQGSSIQVENAGLAGIHSRMDPNLWSQVNDAARTGLDAVQTLISFRRTKTPDRTAEIATDAVMIPGASTEVPAVPRSVHGREEIVGYLLKKANEPHRHVPRLLVGAGGMGKSTIAQLTATKLREKDPRRQIWWVSAASEESLSDGLISVARSAGASPAVQELIRSHVIADLGGLIDQIWYLLERHSSRWLLVIDNADKPSLLGAADGTGWVRSTPNVSTAGEY